jgi:nucleotide-binding universal stress UspA family protein
MYKHILIPTDGSDLADKAVEQGIMLAKLTGADLTLLRVTAPPAPLVVEGVVVAYPQEEVQKQVKARVEAHLGGLADKAKAAGVKVVQRQAEHDHPWKAIVDTAKDIGASLIVMSSHGRRGLSALVIGSETQKVLTHTDVPVLVCR